MKTLAVAITFAAAAMAVPANEYLPPPPFPPPPPPPPTPPPPGNYEPGPKPPYPPPFPPPFPPPSPPPGFPGSPGFPGGGSDGVLCKNGDKPEPQCCKVNVLGLVEFDCRKPPVHPNNVAEFKGICAADNNEKAQCCTLEALGVGIICEDPY